MNSVRSNSLIFMYQRLTPQGCKNFMDGKSEFVALSRLKRSIVYYIPSLSWNDSFLCGV